MNIEILQTTTKDGLRLKAHLFGSKTRSVILYIHGFEGDFFSHDFVHTMAAEAVKNDVAFLTVQTRGSGSLNEMLRADGSSGYYGSRLELLEEAHLDINAWVLLLRDLGYKDIILAGHSLGTLKAVRYLFEGECRNYIKKLLLLCPFDKNGQEDIVTDGKWRDYVKEAQELIQQGRGKEMIPSNWEEVTMSYQTFHSWYQEDDLGCMFDFYRPDYSFPILKSINIPVHIIVGSQDEYFHRTNPLHPREAMDILLHNLKQGSGVIIPEAKHSFRGFEQNLAEELTKFLQST